MITLNRKETLYLFREQALKLIYIYGAETEIYFYYSPKYRDIIYLSLIKVDFLVSEIKEGKITLFKILIYTLIQEYPNVKLAQLILIAYRITYRYSMLQMARIIGCTENQYEKLETGYSNFEEQYSFDNLAIKLNLPKEYFISELNFSPVRLLEQEQCLKQ